MKSKNICEMGQKNTKMVFQKCHLAILFDSTLPEGMPGVSAPLPPSVLLDADVPSEVGKPPVKIMFASLLWGVCPWFLYKL